MTSDRVKTYGANDLGVENFTSPPTIVVRSPLFESSPRRDSCMRVHPLNLHDPTASSDGELPPGWRTAEQQQRTLVSRRHSSATSQQFASGFASSSSEEGSRYWRTTQYCHPNRRSHTYQLDYMPDFDESQVRGRNSRSRGRRFSEGSYKLASHYYDQDSSQKSDCDVFIPGLKRVGSGQLLEEGMIRSHGGSGTGGGLRIKNVFSKMEDASESELKRSRLEWSASEVYAKQRSKIRVLEGAEDPGLKWKCPSPRGIGSGGIGRGRIVNEPGSTSGAESRELLTCSSFRSERKENGQENNLQWPTPSSHEVGEKFSPRPLFRHEGLPPAGIHGTRPHRRRSMSWLEGHKFGQCLTVDRLAVMKCVTVNNEASTEHSSSDVDSQTDCPSITSGETSSLRCRSSEKRSEVYPEPEASKKIAQGSREVKATRSLSLDGNAHEGYESSSLCGKPSSALSPLGSGKTKCESPASLMVAGLGNDLSGESVYDKRKKRKSSRKKRSQSPTSAVACAASMIGDTVEAVRKVREDAAELAFKLAELHAHDAKALRSAAVAIRHHVDSLQTEVHSFQFNWDRKDTVEFPWNSFMREFLVAASMVSGVFSIHAFINSVRKALGLLKQTATRKEKLSFALLLLTVGVGTGAYHSLGQVQSVRRDRENQLRVHLKCIMERTSLLSALAHTDPTSSSPETSAELDDERQVTM